MSEAPDDKVRRADSVQIHHCDCCGEITLWFFGEDGEPFAAAKFEPEEFIGLVNDAMDQLTADDEPDGFPAVQGSA